MEKLTTEEKSVEDINLQNGDIASYVTVKDYYNVEELPADPALRKKLKVKIVKNLVLISTVFVLVFTAYNGLGNLQSSLHIDEGMGTVTQSVVYGSMVLSCLFIPKLMISSLGIKWTMPICILGYLLWMAANGYAVWWTMVPTSILVGVAAGPLWTAQRVYFNKIAPKYAALLNEPEDVVISRLFGFFFGFFQISTLAGAVISSTVLKPAEDSNDTLTSDEIRMYCGINDCPDDNVTNPNQTKPNSTTLWTLVGIYIGITCLGILIVCTLIDDLPKYLNDDKATARKQIKQSLIKTAVHLKRRSMILLVPVTIANGLEQGFNGAEWNNSFVSCSLGIWMVGLLSIPASVVNAAAAFLAGHLLKYFRRLPIFTFGYIVHLAFQFSMIFWPLDPDKEYVFYILVCVRSIADGIWQTQVNAMYGTIFADNSEGAFSNQKMWDSVGFIIAFAYSSFLCTDIKVYVLMGLSAVSMVLYYIVEYWEYKKAKTAREIKDTVDVDISAENVNSDDAWQPSDEKIGKDNLACDENDTYVYKVKDDEHNKDSGVIIDEETLM